MFTSSSLKGVPFNGDRNITSADTVPWKRGARSQGSLADWLVDHLGFVLGWEGSCFSKSLGSSLEMLAL